MLMFTVELSGNSEVKNGTAMSNVVGCEWETDIYKNIKLLK
jgi:hypothetical protein